MLELLALLLPVAAASGWWAAKRSARRGGPRSGRVDMDPAYFRGLNYLVNEQPDKAIDVFVRMLEVNSETVELHFALANLFRRRGEVDRAIRIHQNLIARPTLSQAQRAQALLELGKDYLRAGLLDRAEALFRELVEMDQQVQPSLKNLIQIFQHEKDWEKCLETSRQLERLGDRQQAHEQAHYYCEMASGARARGDLRAAAALLAEAKKADSGNVRVLLMLGELAMVREDYRKAVDFFEEVEARHPMFEGEVIGPLALCHQRLGQEARWREHLRERYEKNPSLPLMRAVAEDIRRRDGEGAAIGFVSKHLETKTGLRGLAYLTELRLAELGEDRTGFVVLLDDLLAQLAEELPAYQCHRCGFAARVLHWQCPGCRSWGTMDPYCERKEKISS
jgi:lipopolysaccharide biosynthesis regulator YciM